MLFDFMDWYEVPNENTYVSTKNNPLNRRHIIGNVADWMSPYKVFAVNDVDGDYASDGEGLFTGGRYILGGSMKDTEAPENLKTARTKSISVSVDGVSVREGFGAYGEKVSVEWVNTVQASNTQKSDGTGREVLEEHIAAQFEGKSVLVSNRITALEDVQIKTYYGMQSCFSGDTVLEYVGCKSNPGLHPCDQNLNTDEYTNGCKAFIGSSYLFEVKINDEGLGNFEYNSSKAGNFINRGSKVYPQLVQQQFAPFLAVKKGQFVEFSGKYFVDVM